MPSLLPKPGQPAAHRAALVPESASTAWLWIAVLPLAAILRLLFLSRESLWLDEAASLGIVRHNWHDFLQVLWQREANMTTFYLALRPLLLYVGDSEFWVRLPAVVAGLAAIPVIFSLGKIVFGRRTALWAALLLAVSGCHVAYSREARGYSMAVLFAALSSLYFLKGIEHRSRTTWFLYAAASALAVYSHFYAGLVLVAQWMSLAVIPRRIVPWKYLLAATALTALLIAPLVAVVLTHNVGQLDWVQNLSWLELYHTGVFLAADEGKVLGTILLVFCLAALGNSALKTIRSWNLTGAPLDRWRRAFLWLWMIVPLLLTAIVSLRVPLFFHRFFIVCLPAFVLLVTWGMTGLRRTPLLIAGFTLLSLITVGQHYRRTRENWREATQDVMAHAQPGDAVFVWHSYGNGPFSYYQGRSNRGSLPEIANLDVALGAPRDYRRLWVVLYPVSPSDPSVDDTGSRLTAKYRVLEVTEYRRIRVLLLDLAR